jgi:tetratricopeptide (TPR) repeat protein
LTTELGQIGELRVISRTSAMTYKRARRSLPQIARELNVDAVVEGSVLRSAVLKSVNRVNPDAYEAYLKGRYSWNQRTADGLINAIGFFNKAIEKDPDYAAAYAGLADAYALSGDWKYGVQSPREAYPKATAAARKAIMLDGTLGEAHISLAFGMDGFDWNWDAAGKEFVRGLELSPGYATGHDWYGWHLAMMGRNGDAVAEAEKAESLDPLSLIIGADLAEELLIAHRYEDAIKQSRKTVNLDPLFAPAYFVLGQALTQKHSYDDAIAALKRAIELSPGSTAFTANLAYSYAMSGRKNEAVKILNDLKARSNDQFSNAAVIAVIYVGLNDRPEAMRWLEKAYAERFNPEILMRPCFDPLRSDTQFRNLLGRLGLIA